MSNSKSDYAEKITEDLPRDTQSTKNGSVFSGYTVMAKSMIGSGILSITFACAGTGLILGIFMLLLAALLTWLSLHVISKLSLEFPDQQVSFYSITQRVLPKYSWTLDTAVLLDCIGSAVCFIHIMGTLLAHAFIELFTITSVSERVMTIITQTGLVAIMFPLSLMKDITDTKIINIIGLICLIYVAILSVVFTDFTTYSTDLLWPTSFTQILIAFPIMIFAFSCQQNILAVVSEMKNPTMKRLDTITGSAINTGLLLYVPVMIFPFITFGRNVNAPTIFGLLPRGHPAVIVGMFAAAISVGISYILVVFPIRASMMSLMYRTNQPTGRKELMVRVLLVTGIVLVSLGTAIGVGKNYGYAISFTGLLGANTCGFVMPCILYLKHFGIDWRSVSSVSILLMLVFCIALYPLGITAAVLELVT